MVFFYKMSELLLVVDQHNNPLPIKKTRQAVHRDGDWHRTSHIFVVNKKQGLLSNLRAPNKKVYPNKWDLIFGGHVAVGETSETTALRELEEEIGIATTIDQLQLIGYNQAVQLIPEEKIINREFRSVYRYHLPDEKTLSIKFQKDEIAAVTFYRLSEIDRLLSNPKLSKNFVPDLDYYRSMIEKIRRIGI